MRPASTLLIVDDEPGIRRSLGEALGEEGYAVLKAEQGEQALELLHNPDSEGIHLMLLDVWLPGMDGLETLKQAKALRPDLPVALASGYVTPEIEKSAFEAGASALVYKPNDVNELCETVQRLILGGHGH